MKKKYVRKIPEFHKQMIAAANAVERIQPKVIGERWDEKRNCKVTILAGPEDKPYKTIPLGMGD